MTVKKASDMTRKLILGKLENGVSDTNQANERRVVRAMKEDVDYLAREYEAACGIPEGKLDEEGIARIFRLYRTGFGNAFYKGVSVGRQRSDGRKPHSGKYRSLSREGLRNRPYRPRDKR